MVTLQIVPYHEIEDLTSVGRIRKLLNLAKEKKIIVLQGTLRAEEEAELIKATMEEINKEFRGIELAVIAPTSTKLHGMSRIKNGLLRIIAGNRLGLTVIGPASLVKDIKKDPSKIELIMKGKK